MPAPPQPDIEARRRSFNARAEEYAAARPPYPEQVYAMLTDHCGLRPGSRVLEIGPGSGLATGPLLALGADVVAVEPGERLAAILERRLGCPWLRVVPAEIETAAVPAGPYQLVVSATAFHWVDPAAALPRLARLLDPAGWLVVWWNVFGDPQRPTEFRVRLDGSISG